MHRRLNWQPFGEVRAAAADRLAKNGKIMTLLEECKALLQSFPDADQDAENGSEEKVEELEDDEVDLNNAENGSESDAPLPQDRSFAAWLAQMGGIPPLPQVRSFAEWLALMEGN